MTLKLTASGLDGITIMFLVRTCQFGEEAPLCGIVSGSSLRKESAAGAEPFRPNLHDSGGWGRWWGIILPRSKGGCDYQQLKGWASACAMGCRLQNLATFQVFAEQKRGRPGSRAA